MSTEMDQHQLNIERFKIKKMTKMLESARGAGTSVITLYIPPKDQIAKHVQLLNVEYGTCSNIKSHTNRLSVQSAITSTLGRLKMYNRTPPNGLIIYCGTVLTEDNKEKKLTLDIEPFKPVSRSLYMCDNKFHTDELHRMLESDETFGFIIVDGNGCYYYTVQGDTRHKLGHFTVELPKKHGRGGQSKNRFARIRMERRHNYLRKVSEGATQHFVPNGQTPNVLGLVLAGSAEFKESLFLSDMFDPRLKDIVIKLVDIAHSGDVGLNQAIDLSSDALSGVKLVQEKKLLGKFYDELALDTNMYCYGVNDTMKAIDMGAVHTLICFEDLDTMRVKVTPAGDAQPTIYYYTPKELEKPEVQKILHATEEGAAANDIETMLLVEFLTENYSKLGFELELVTDKSQEGTQFVRGFGGMGGLLRYKVDMMQLAELERQGEDEEGGADFDIDDDFM